MTIRLVPSTVNGFVVMQDGVATAKGEEWEETLGEFKGLQRMVNLALGATVLVIDGRIGPLTYEHVETALADAGWTEGLTLSGVASRARELAVFLGRRLGVTPDFSPDRLPDDYRGEVEPSGKVLVKTEVEPEGGGKLSAEREVETAGGGKILVGLAVAAGAYMTYRWWKSRKSRLPALGDAGDSDGEQFG